jgi:hypothetical protein
MIELYRFDYGSTVYRYTSADRDVTYDEATWTAPFRAFISTQTVTSSQLASRMQMFGAN